MRIEVAREIDAPAEAVYATLLDISRWPGFMPAIKLIELVTPGPVAVSTRFRETRIMHGREATEEMCVAALEPARRVLLTAESHGARYTADHILEPSATGTRLRLAFDAQPVTLVARLLQPLARMAKGALERQLTADLASLAAEAERRAKTGR